MKTKLLMHRSKKVHIHYCCTAVFTIETAKNCQSMTSDRLLFHVLHKGKEGVGLTIQEHIISPLVICTILVIHILRAYEVNSLVELHGDIFLYCVIKYIHTTQ